MGMAASQARYLEITARKTNVEYEGQQINQQRTALANESAGLFNQLMDLQVPTAPSTTDYTTTQYSFSDGNNNYTITDMKNLTGDANFNKTVTYYYTQPTYTGISKARSDLGVTGSGTTASPYWFTDGTGTVNKKAQLTQCSASDTDYATDKKAIEQAVSDLGNSTQFAKDYNNNGTPDITKIYKYTAADGKTYYYCNTDLSNASQKSGQATSITGYYAATLDKKVYSTANAYVKTTESGRYTDIKLDGYSNSFDLAAKTTTDSNAYNNAMNEYEYQQQRYQKDVTDINAKTSVIEKEDRALEMKLKQLDTEQEALQTEMDSVKKVIDKNIEQTFKTFSS